MTAGKLLNIDYSKPTDNSSYLIVFVRHMVRYLFIALGIFLIWVLVH